MKTFVHENSQNCRPNFVAMRAFSLLEVMIAVAIFFMATFSILALVSRCLAQARALQPMQVDANMVAAELSLTNILEEGPIPPEIIQHFEHMYPNYTCGGTITEIKTNGFFQVDIEVGGVTSGKHVTSSKNTVYLFRPQSASRRGFGPGR
jgi:Tfp pilus assembly protein PilV